MGTCYKPSETATIRQNVRQAAINGEFLRLLATTCDLRRARRMALVGVAELR